MAVAISKASGLNDDLWNEWAPLIRSYIMDADKDKNKYDELLNSMFNINKSDKFGEKNTGDFVNYSLKINVVDETSENNFTTVPISEREFNVD